MNNIITSGTEYSSQNFRKISCIDQTFEDIQFTKCAFDHIDFSNTEFSKCRFDNCIFKNCILNVLKPTKSKFIDCEFTSCKLTGINWSICDDSMGFTIKCTECDLSYSSFINMNLPKSAFHRCKLYETEFSGCILKQVAFCKSDLLRTVFAHNDLSQADFREAINYVFDIRENKVKHAKFSASEVLNLLLPFELDLDKKI